MPIFEQLPTKGAEADIFVVGAGGERRVLKLYRHRMEPKIEVLRRVADVSRRNRQYFVEFFDTGFDEATGRWYELQEYMPLGSLKDIPQDVKRAPDFIARFVPELAGAIHCLHENEIIHCDIKPANILIRSLDPPDIVLTDFGISSILAADVSQKMTGLKGTPMYWAPEAFSREIGRPCDWWGMGIVVLELLAGGNPFEGMNDSQIIHRLTLGNVGIPDSIDPMWATLVRGLLTKDDSRRWGKEEIDRWSSGDRDVPVFYSNEQAVPGRLKPFQFEGADYYDEASLAHAFASSEAAWLASLGYLHYLRRWFEANLKFDEAMKIGQAEASGDPELAFFRFVHANTRLPFSMMGRTLGENSLEEFLDLSIRGKSSQSENRIMDMMTSGRLLAYYDEYTGISGTEPDARFRGILKLMIGHTPDEQRDYFAAMRERGDFVWPHGTEGADGNLAETLRLMGRPPMRRDFWNAVMEKYALPTELISEINSGTIPSYVTAVSTLESWRAKGMLLAGDSAWDYAGYENLSVEEYERTARATLLGHTSAALKEMDRIAGDLEHLWKSSSVFSAHAVAGAVEKVLRLRDRKLSPPDTAFIVRITKLLDEHESLTRVRWRNYAIICPIAGISTWLIQLIGGRAGNMLLQGSLIFSVIVSLAILYRWTCFANDAANGYESGVFTGAVWAYFIGLLVAAFILYDRLYETQRDILAFLTGALPAAMFQFGLESVAFARNNSDILDACATYEKSPVYKND
ncbi:MAG: protein kinase [Synergistaceae bacterium]|nr:protein kinase [Synergistaceae bacterium]